MLADAEEAEARRLTLEALEALLDKVARKAGLFDAMAAALRTETAVMEVRPQMYHAGSFNGPSHQQC